MLNDFVSWLMDPDEVELDAESKKVLQKANRSIKQSKSVEETADAISDALFWSLLRQIRI